MSEIELELTFGHSCYNLMKEWVDSVTLLTNMLKECFYLNIKRIFKNIKQVQPEYLTRKCCSSENVIHEKTNPRWNIMFFGTDDFSVASLKVLENAYKNRILVRNLEVVTNIRNKPNAVQEFATISKLKLHNWRDLKPNDIEANLFDAGIVVSFGNLIPARIINEFPLGILNVHASLLPKWRGAAPIVHALASGDTETGVTIMKIKPKHFDIGEIVCQKSIPIPPTILLPELTCQLAELGAEILLETVKKLPKCLDEAHPQSNLGTSYAPRVHQDSARISWSSMDSTKIYNLYRSLKNLFPLQCTWMGHPVKFFDVSLSDCCDKRTNIPGYTVFSKKENCLRVECLDGKGIIVNKLGVSGRKPMSSKDFYNGFMSKYHPKRHVFT